MRLFSCVSYTNCLNSLLLINSVTSIRESNTNDSSLYNTIQGRWKIAAEREKEGTFFFQTWNGYFMDISADSIRIIQLNEEKDLDFDTKNIDSICLSSYKMSFRVPNRLVFYEQFFISYSVNQFFSLFFYIKQCDLINVTLERVM